MLQLQTKCLKCFLSCVPQRVVNYELWSCKLELVENCHIGGWHTKIGGANLQVQVVEIEVASFKVRLQTLRLYLQVWKDC
jgi:hypothetical protein